MAKKKQARPARRALSYAEQHNRSLRIYLNAASFLTWAGLMNFLGTIFSLFNANGGTFYYLNFAFNNWIFRALEAAGWPSNQPVGFVVLLLIIAAISGALFILLGQLARRGYSWALITGTAIYLADMVVVFLIPGTLESFANIQIAALFHALMLAMMLVALIFYYHIVNLQRKQTAEENNNSGNSTFIPPKS